MQRPVRLGKHPGRTLAATGVPVPPTSHLFHVLDPHTRTQFLVDTGSEVSAIPPSPADRRRSPDSLTLMAVNDTPICTYRKHSLTLNLGLRCSLPWIFVIVQKPILGADSLRHFGLLVDMQQRRLINSQTRLHIQGIITTSPSPSPSICAKGTNNHYLYLYCLSSQHLCKCVHQTHLLSMT